MRHEPTAAELRRASRVFKALSHPDRLRLTCLVAEREGVTQKGLVEDLGWPQSTVARHLSTLRERGLLVGRRRGAEVVLEALPLPRVLLDTVCDHLRAEGEDVGAVEGLVGAGGPAAGRGA